MATMTVSAASIMTSFVLGVGGHLWKASGMFLGLSMLAAVAALGLAAI